MKVAIKKGKRAEPINQPITKILVLANGKFAVEINGKMAFLNFNPKNEQLLIWDDAKRKE